MLNRYITEGVARDALEGKYVLIYVHEDQAAFALEEFKFRVLEGLITGNRSTEYSEVFDIEGGGMIEITDNHRGLTRKKPDVVVISNRLDVMQLNQFVTRHIDIVEAGRYYEF